MWGVVLTITALTILVVKLALLSIPEPASETELPSCYKNQPCGILAGQSTVERGEKDARQNQA